MSERQKLKQIFTSIYSKVTSIQIDHNFDITLEKELQKTYVSMNDNFFFKQLCDLVFQSGLRGQIWLRYEPEIRKQFRDYKVKKVANYTQKDVERMLANPKMLKHRKKIEACIYNAIEIVKISKEYNGFWHFLDRHKVEELVEKLKSNFKWVGLTNAYAFLRYVGMEVIKPDINIRRVLFRLGLLDSMALTPKTYKQIQEVGKRMAKANNVRMTVIDYSIYAFGSGEKPIIKYAICGKVPKCNECSLTSSCDFYQGK